MAVTYGYFNSINGDRKYNADQMSDYFRGIVNEGVFQHLNGGLAVVAGTGMEVTVATGRAIVQNKWVQNDAAFPLTIEAASDTYGRKDAVVIRLSYTNRAISIAVKTGTPSASPAAPSLTRSSTTYEMALAYVNVSAGATSVTVTDKRSDTSVCGWATVAQETSGEVDAMLEALKTGFDGVVYSSPAAMVQGCDQKLQDEIDSFGNNKTDNDHFNIYGSSVCPVKYAKRLSYLDPNNSYSPVEAADNKTSYGVIDLTTLECKELTVYVPQTRPTSGQFIMITDESTVAVNIPNIAEMTTEVNTEYWTSDFVNHIITVHVAQAKSIGYKKLYVSSGYETDSMYVYSADFSFDWLSSDCIINSVSDKIDFSKNNIYGSKYTSDEIGFCNGYDTSTYLPSIQKPSLTYPVRSRFVVTKIDLIENIKFVYFDMPQKTVSGTTLTQAIILSGSSSAFNITYSGIESDYNTKGVISDGEKITLDFQTIKKNGYTKVYIAHVYDPTFKLYASDVVVDWLGTKHNIEHLPVPQFYNVANGDVRMFINGLFVGDLDEFDFEKFGVGNLKSRYVDYSTIGATDYFTRIETYKSGKLIDSIQIPYKSVATTAKSGQTIKVLMIGDSTIAAGIITAQLVNVASKNNLTIETLGTLPKTVQNSDDQTVTVNTEGRAGWATYDYLHTESYNGSTNAFLNNGAFDFSAYMSANSIATPDWITIQLGINDDWRPMNGTTTWDNIKTMIDSIREYSNTVKIGVALCLPPYMGENRLANAKNTNLRRFNNSKGIIENLSSLSGVYIIPISVAFDAEYAFNTTTEQIGDWITKEITVPTDETHPSKYGYYQIADMYNAAIMCN